jgi:hypothetical protein
MLASLGRQRRLEAAGIEEAWADLQQLPAPWQPGTQPASAGAESSGVVEFGQLDDGAEAYGAEAHLSDSIEPDSIEPAARLDPDEQIELIQRQVAAARDEEDFHPAGSIGPEVELVFHGPHDPFGQAFDEEEVVIDRYALLESGGLRRRPRFSSEDVRELAAALSSAVRNDPPPSLAIAEETRQHPSAQPRHASPHLAVQHVSRDIDPAGDPRMPAADALQERPAQEHDDDSDLIVVDDSRETASRAPATRARRQEYRQLFAKLRRG